MNRAQDARQHAKDAEAAVLRTLERIDAAIDEYAIVWDDLGKARKRVAELETTVRNLQVEVDAARVETRTVERERDRAAEAAAEWKNEAERLQSFLNEREEKMKEAEA